MERGHWVQFDLSVTGITEQMRVRIGHFDERAVASVELGQMTTNGIGASARDALVAALAPLGTRVTSTVLAAPAMFGASVELMTAGE
jgi:hypothetical protein